MSEISDIQRHTRGYWFSDGIAEVVGGLALLVVGGLLYASGVTGKELLATAALFVMIVGFPATARIGRWAKDRLTHVRTGYLKYPEPSRSRKQRAVLVAGATGFAVAFAAVALGDQGLEGGFGRSLLLAVGIALAMAYANRARALGMPRFYVSAAVLGGVAVWALVTRAGFLTGLGVMWILLGATSVVAGTITLAGYLRDTHGMEADLS
jgi:hypothetical protein